MSRDPADARSGAGQSHLTRLVWGHGMGDLFFFFNAMFFYELKGTVRLSELEASAMVQTTRARTFFFSVKGEIITWNSGAS